MEPPAPSGSSRPAAGGLQTKPRLQLSLGEAGLLVLPPPAQAVQTVSASALTGRPAVQWQGL